MKIIAAILLWWAIGASGFTYWWTKDYDLTWREVPLAVFLGSFGPLTWGMGWVVHGEHDGAAAVLVPRR